MKIITRLSAIALLAAGAMTAAHAAPVSDISSGDADIIFGGTDTATIVITPVSGLKAGPATALKVADGSVTTTGTGNYAAYRWTPASGTVGPSGAARDTIELTGRSTGKKIIFVTASTSATVSPSDSAWFVGNAKDTKINFTISTGPSAQTVPVDVFNTSMDGAVWIE